MAHASHLHEVKHILRLASPLVIAHIIQGLSPFIGVMMLGNLSADALAASGLVSSVFGAVISFFLGTLNAIAILTAQAHGAKDYRKITHLFQQGLVFAMLMSLPQILLFLTVPGLLHWIDQPATIIQLAGTYLEAVAWAIIPLTYFVTLEQLLIGLGHAKALMFFTWVTVPIEILAMYLFIYGKLGFPTLGIAGIGYGMTTAFLVGCMLISGYLIWHPACRPYAFFGKLTPLEPNLFAELIRIGVPIGIMFGMEFTALGVMSLLMGQFVSDMLAAHQITIQYMHITLMILFGITQAITVRIGQAVGQGEHANLLRIGYLGTAIALAFISGVVLIYWFFPTWLIALDLDIQAAENQRIVAYTTQFLLIVGFFQIMDALRITMAGALRGMKDAQAPMWVSIFSFWGIGLPIGIAFGFGLNWQGAGMWSGMTIGIAVGAGILLYRFHKLASLKPRSVNKLMLSR